jgi:hypothetical protein
MGEAPKLCFAACNTVVMLTLFTAHRVRLGIRARSWAGQGQGLMLIELSAQYGPLSFYLCIS